MTVDKRDFEDLRKQVTDIVARINVPSGNMETEANAKDLYNAKVSSDMLGFGQATANPHAGGSSIDIGGEFTNEFSKRFDALTQKADDTMPAGEVQKQLDMLSNVIDALTQYAESLILKVEPVCSPIMPCPPSDEKPFDSSPDSGIGRRIQALRQSVEDVNAQLHNATERVSL